MPVALLVSSALFAVLLPLSFASGVCTSSSISYYYDTVYYVATTTDYYTYYTTSSYCCNSWCWSTCYKQDAHTGSQIGYQIASYTQLNYRYDISYQCCAGYVGTPNTACSPFCSPTCVYGQCTDPNICTCNSGWTGGVCSDDVDECLVNNGGCGQNCTNTQGSYICSCWSGYSLAYDYHQCPDINECATSNGGCQQNCINTPGSYHCSCQSGYEMKNDSRSCNDINECLVANGGCSHNCMNTPGSFNCTCKTGFALASNGLDCNDIPECSLHLDNCSQICIEEQGGYSCSCSIGYTLESDQSSCADIDECKMHISGCNQNCTNTIGSYTCSCFSNGYVLTDKYTCTDLNECSMNNGGCDHQCTNTIGSYICTCYRGFKLSDNKHMCQNIQCPALLAPDHGSMICNGNETGNWCVFTCQGGYNLMGAPTRYCLITLQWSGNTTTCDAMTCPTPSLPQNVLLTRPCIGKYNTSCSIVCPPEYKLVGSSTLKCVFNAVKRVVEWSSASAPFCKRGNPCDSNPCMRNGTCTSPEDGKYVCNCTNTGYSGPTCSTGDVTVQVPQVIKVGSNASILLTFPPGSQLIVTVFVSPSNLIPTPSMIALPPRAAVKLTTNVPVGVYTIQYNVSGRDSKFFNTPPTSIVMVTNSSSNATRPYFTAAGTKPGFLKPGCCSYRFFTCPASNTQVNIISTCEWVKSTQDTLGVVFAATTATQQFSLPVSINGLSMLNNRFQISLSTANNKLCVPCSSPPGCRPYRFQQSDVNDLIATRSLSTTYLENIKPLFPSWVTMNYSSTDMNGHQSFDSYDLFAQVGNMVAIKMRRGCENILFTADGTYSALQFNHPLSLKIGEESILYNVDAMSPLCLVVDMCKGPNSPLYIGLNLQAQKAILSLSFLQPYLLRGWKINTTSIMMQASTQQYNLSSILFWNGMNFDHLPSPTYDLSMNLNLLIPLNYGHLTLNLKFSGVGYGLYENSNPHEKSYVLSGDNVITIITIIEGDVQTITLSDATTPSIVIRAENADALPGIFLNLNYQPKQGDFFSTSLFTLPETVGVSCPVSVFASLDNNFALQGLSLYTNCTDLNIGGLVFQNLVHTMVFDGLNDYTINSSDDDVFSFTISSSLQGDSLNLGPFLTLLNAPKSAEMIIRFHPMTKGYFGEMKNVQVTILDANITTPISFQGDLLYFSADDTVIFQNYSANLSISATLNCQWIDLLLQINGTLSSDPEAFHAKVEAKVHYYIQSITSTAKQRLSEAKQSVIALSQQLSELKLEYMNKMVGLNASQDAYRTAYGDLQIPNNTFIELQNNYTMLSNTTRQLQNRLSSVCDEETCSDICIPGVVLSQCYQSVAITVPYSCTVIQYVQVISARPVIVSRWKTVKSCYSGCYSYWFLFWSDSSCYSYCTIQNIQIYETVIEPFVSYAPVTVYQNCFYYTSRTMSYQCYTNVGCAQKAPDLECATRNAACRASRKLAVDTLDKSQQLTAAVLVKYSEARQNLSIAQVKEATAAHQLFTSQTRFDAIASAYNNALIANASAQGIYMSTANEIANDLSLAYLLDANTIDTLFNLSSITFNVSIKSESPTELPLNFTYQKFQQFYSTLITLDFTIDQDKNTDHVAKLLVKQAYNTQARKRSAWMSKRQLTAQSNSATSISRCDNLINTNKFLKQLESSLQSIEMSSHSGMEYLPNSAEPMFGIQNSINFTALSKDFNVTITQSSLMDLVSMDKGLTVLNDAIGTLKTISMQKPNISEKAAFYDWQAQVGFLLNKTNSVGGNPCFGLNDCLVTLSGIIQQLLQSSAVLLNKYAVVKQNLAAVAGNTFTSISDIVHKIDEVIGIINSTDLNDYWCSMKPNITDIPAGNQSVVLGGILNLTCIANSMSVIQYQWRKNGNAMPGSKNSSLIKYNVQQSDEGSYVCYASNAGGTSRSIAINVTIHYAPTFYSTPVPISVLTGNPNGARFGCNATANPAAGWRWYFRGLNGTNIWQPLIGPNMTNELFIPSPQKRDEGWYKCEAYNDYGNILSDPVYLTVLSATISQLAIAVNYLMVPQPPILLRNCSSRELGASIKHKMELVVDFQHATIKNISFVRNSDGSVWVTVVVASFNVTTDQISFQSIDTIINSLSLYAPELQSIKTSIKAAFVNGSFVASCNNSIFSAPTYSLSISDYFPLCPPGQELHTSLVYCVACAPGQYQTMAEQTRQLPGVGTTTGQYPICQPCPLKTFEDREGSVMCRSCPQYHLTNHTGATSVSDCIAEPLVMDCSLYNITSQDVLINCTVNHFPSNFTCSFDNGPIQPCKMPVEITTRMFFPGSHSVVITAMDIFQKSTKNVVHYTLQLGPLNGNSVVVEVKRVGSLRTAYRIVNSSQLVWEAYQNVGYRYNYTTAANWPPPQFYRVSISNPGDVLLFSGYVAIYVRTGYLYGPQETTGPTEARFGLTAPYWGSQNALRGCYRWRS